MPSPEPTLDDYVAIGRIYSDNRLSREELLERGQKSQEANRCAALEDGMYLYLRQEFNVPLRYWGEILQLGRPLSDLEREALYLKSKVAREGAPGISISIEGLA